MTGAVELRCLARLFVLAILLPAFVLAVEPKADKKAKEKGAELFDSSRIRHFKIVVAEPALTALKKDNRKYVRAAVTEGTNVFKDVAIRLKGMGSFQPLEAKPSFAIKFDQYTPGQKFCGLSKFMLNNSSQDGTYLAELMSLGMFRDAGLPAARVTHAFVEFNGRDLGVYTLIEAVNKDFLGRYFANPKGNLYEAYLQDIDADMDVDNGEKGDQSDRKALVAVTKITDTAERWQKLQAALDVDKFISYLVLEMFTSHTDGYAMNRNNYRIYHDPVTDRFVFVTHGIDWGFGNTGVSIWPPMNSIMVRAVLQCPEGRRQYRERVGELFTNVFKMEIVTNRLNMAAERLKAAARNPNEKKMFEGCVAEMRNRLIQRLKNIADQLAQPPPEPLNFGSSGMVKVSNWHTQQDSGNSKLDRPDENGKHLLHIASNPEGCIASWRTRVLLGPGKYTFQAQARAKGIAPQESDIGAGAGLRKSGGKRTNKLVGDSDWKRVEYQFDVASGEEEVVLVCELRATKGEVWFDADSLQLVKK